MVLAGCRQVRKLGLAPEAAAPTVAVPPQRQALPSHGMTAKRPKHVHGRTFNRSDTSHVHSCSTFVNFAHGLAMATAMLLPRHKLCFERRLAAMMICNYMQILLPETLHAEGCTCSAVPHDQLKNRQ
jgi:hypothetical protein